MTKAKVKENKIFTEKNNTISMTVRFEICNSV